MSKLEKEKELVEALKNVIPDEVTVKEENQKISMFAVGPVDKGSGELAIMCQEKWAQGVRSLAEGMRKMPTEEVGEVRTRMATAGRELKFLPFVRLEKVEKHEWGPLRACPKWKSLRLIWCAMAKYEMAEERMMQAEESNTTDSEEESNEE